MTLDEAWAAVEAVLPHGWAIASLRHVTDWTAEAVDNSDESDGDFVQGHGATPAAALIALAEALRKQ